MLAIDIQGLSKTYKGKRNQRVEALKNLDLAIGQGEILGLLGPNGAGKSTTIKILTGQIRATQGGARLAGTSVENYLARRKVGYLSENPAFYDFMTACEYLHFVANVHCLPRQIINQRISYVLKRLDLNEAANRPLKGYSKGMIQRLGLAQALLADPDVYILDEPMSGLDPIGRALVKEIILELADAGKTVLFSTHITADVERVCDRVAILVQGRLMAAGGVRDILSKDISGYRLEIVDARGENRILDVSPDNLKVEIESLLAEKATIERIEPNRGDLEAFFLDIVSRNKGQHL